MSEVNFENLLSTGAHFGHVTRKWHPAYEPFILMERNGVHIINFCLLYTSDAADE